MKGGAELDLLDERPGPERLVAGAPGGFDQAGGFRGRLLEFLFVDETFDELSA
jgi:hypothetical protein